MLKQRIITALILIPITLALLYFLSPGWIGLLLGLLTLGAAWEWSNLAEIKKTGWRLLYLIVIALLLIDTLFVPAPLIFMIAFLWWLFASVLVIFYPRGSYWWNKSGFLRCVMGVFVMVPCWRAVYYIRSQSDGFFALLFLFVLIWGADSAAYFVGRACGKHKLAPLVSPGKSWEGLVGALIFSALIALLASWSDQIPLHVVPWVIALALVTVLFSVMGDLFESMLKRQAGLKDSGTILPGHGGLLDRIDSLTAAAPVFAFFAWVLGQYFG